MAEAAGGMDVDGKELVRIEAIINGSRRLRIAKGSGTTVQEVNHLLKQYTQARKMMKRFAQMGEKGFRRGGMPFFS